MPVTFVTSGELRSRIDIIRPVGTASATGGVVEGSPEVFASKVPAAIGSNLFAASEALKSGALTSVVTHVIRMRYLSGLSSWMQVRFETRLFQIMTVMDLDERHIEHQLFCAEVQ